MSTPAFSRLFALYIDWPLRLGKEIPFLAGILRGRSAVSVLDVGSGEGRHAIALAAEGFEVRGCDLSEGLVAEARALAGAEESGARFFVSCMTCVHETAGARFDAVLCLGNTLSMLPSMESLESAVRSMSDALNPGGTMVVHLVNYAGLRAGGKRFGPPRLLGDGRIVLKVFELGPGGAGISVAVLSPPSAGKVKIEHAYHPLLEAGPSDLAAAFSAAGLNQTAAFGACDSSGFDPARSPEIWAVAAKS